MTNPNQSDKPLLEDVFRAASVYYNYTGMTKCNDISDQSQSLGLDGWSFQVLILIILSLDFNINVCVRPVLKWFFRFVLMA
jgi:lysosomal Pro-X carboxypeptidase